VFEALALGIIVDLTFFINLFVAIILHKWAESLSLAITFLNNNFEQQKAKQYIFFFSLTGPLGIICGWILSYISKILAAVFFSISSGTFIYITMMEVLPDEFAVEEERKHKWIKFILFNVGFIIITSIWFMES
jgi:zinc transporter 1/2/3